MSVYHLNKAIYELGRCEDRAAILADKAAWLAPYDLSQAERDALVQPNFAALREHGLLPNLLFRYYLYHGLPVAQFRQRMLEDAERMEAES